MITIKNRDELKKYLNKDKDLILPKENITLEFTITRDDVRNIECRNLVACKDDKYFDINARNIDTWNINAWNINAWDINAGNIDALNIIAWNINARNIIAWNISYYAFCTSYTSIKCKSWVKRYEKGKDPICLDGELIIRNLR